MESRPPRYHNITPINNSRELEKEFQVAPKYSGLKPRRRTSNRDPKQRDYSPAQFFESVGIKRLTNLNDMQEYETSKKRAVSSVRGSTRVSVNHSMRITNSNTQGLNYQLGNRSKNSSGKETPKKRSISAQREHPNSKQRNNISVDNQDNFNMSNDSNRQYFINSTKASHEREDFLKFEKVEPFTRKRVHDDPHLPIANTNNGKLPSVEEKRKRLTALQDFMNVNYGKKPESEDKSFSKEKEEKKSATHDFNGGNIRKKMYRLKGGGNTTHLSDHVNGSMNEKIIDQNSSLPEKSEKDFSESEMNPEEMHYFFVDHIQKSRKMLS